MTAPDLDPVRPATACPACGLDGRLVGRVAELQAENERLRAALERRLRDDLAGLANDGTPESGEVVERECPHGQDVEACPWSDVHARIAIYREALGMARAAAKGAQEA